MTVAILKATEFMSPYRNIVGWGV